MSGFDVRTPRRSSKIDQKSLREPVERRASNKTASEAPTGRSGRAFRTLRGAPGGGRSVPGAPRNAPGGPRSVPKASRGISEASLEDPGHPPDRPRSPRIAPKASRTDFTLISPSFLASCDRFCACVRARVRLFVRSLVRSFVCSFVRSFDRTFVRSLFSTFVRSLLVAGCAAADKKNCALRLRRHLEDAACAPPTL